MEVKELKKKNLRELQKLAKELKVENYSQFRKDELFFKVYKKYNEEIGYKVASGYLELLNDGYGFLRVKNYSFSSDDIYVSPILIKKYGLRMGDHIIGPTKGPVDNEKYAALIRPDLINMQTCEEIVNRTHFDDLIPLHPDEKITLEYDPSELSTRIIDLISPIGKGQRGLIVSPPKAGKTVLLQKIANSISRNYPDMKIIILLIDERPEEVTDMVRSTHNAEVVASTFDEPIQRHIQVSELVINKAKRMVELGKDVIILLDSITRLARAYNLAMPNTGQTLSGGVNPAALYKPKKFFGAARNIENGGSLTILATALIETNSKMDEVIFEEFKGTGNMELILDRKLFEKRIFPAIDIKRSGTRREELLLPKNVLNKVWVLRRILNPLSTSESIELLIRKLSQTKSNEEFLKKMVQQEEF